LSDPNRVRLPDCATPRGSTILLPALLGQVDPGLHTRSQIRIANGNAQNAVTRSPDATGQLVAVRLPQKTNRVARRLEERAPESDQVIWTLVCVVLEREEGLAIAEAPKPTSRVEHDQRI